MSQTRRTAPACLLTCVGEALIQHELLPHLFSAYSTSTGIFAPVEQLRYWYPLDAPPKPTKPTEPTGPSLAEPRPRPDSVEGSPQAEPPKAEAALDPANGSATEVDAGNGDGGGGAIDMLVHVIDSARALVRSHTLDAVRSGHLAAALVLLAEAQDAKEATSAVSQRASK